MRLNAVCRIAKMMGRTASMGLQSEVWLLQLRALLCCRCLLCMLPFTAVCAPNYRLTDLTELAVYATANAHQCHVTMGYGELSASDAACPDVMFV